MSSPDLYKADLLRSELKRVKKELRQAVALLAQVREDHYLEPNPDFYEKCSGCGWYSPGYKRGESHRDGCLVVDIAKFMVGR